MYIIILYILANYENKLYLDKNAIKISIHLFNICSQSYIILLTMFLFPFLIKKTKQELSNVYV